MLVSFGGSSLKRAVVLLVIGRAMIVPMDGLPHLFKISFEKHQRVAVTLDARPPLGRSSPRRDLSTSHMRMHAQSEHGLGYDIFTGMSE